MGDEGFSARWSEASAKTVSRGPSLTRVPSYARRQQSTRDSSIVGEASVVRSASTSRAASSSKKRVANPFLPPSDSATATPLTAASARSSSLRKISLHGLNGSMERELGSCASISIFADYEFAANQTSRASIRKGKSRPPDDPIYRSSLTRTTFGSDAEAMLTDRLYVNCREPLTHEPQDLQTLKSVNDPEISNWGFTLDGWHPQEREGWLGFVLKTGSEVSVALPSSWDQVALTSRQWAYAVAVRQGDMHLCALDLAGAFWYTANFLKANSRRVKHEAKIAGIFPSCRVVVGFPHEQFVRWLCVGSHDIDTPPVGLEDLTRRRSTSGGWGDATARKFSMRSLKKPPCVGFIRQDLSFSISPFRAALAEATGLKGGFISVRKFALGLCRNLLEKKRSPGEASLALYNELSLVVEEGSWKGRLRVNEYSPDDAETQTPAKTIYLPTFELICPRVSCAKQITLNSTPPNIRPISLCLSRLLTP